MPKLRPNGEHVAIVEMLPTKERKDDLSDDGSEKGILAGRDRRDLGADLRWASAQLNMIFCTKAVSVP